MTEICERAPPLPVKSVDPVGRLGLVQRRAQADLPLVRLLTHPLALALQM